tara:strand:+ start:1000 stop:1593 length:594 start_codon:yes stop_codon:yes gene_type:complete
MSIYSKKINPFPIFLNQIRKKLIYTNSDELYIRSPVETRDVVFKNLIVRRTFELFTRSQNYNNLPQYLPNQIGYVFSVPYTVLPIQTTDTIMLESPFILAGVYLVSASIRLASGNTANQISLSIIVNGVSSNPDSNQDNERIGHAQNFTFTNNSTIISTRTIFQCNGNQKIKMICSASSQSQNTLLANTNLVFLRIS